MGFHLKVNVPILTFSGGNSILVADCFIFLVLEIELMEIRSLGVS